MPTLTRVKPKLKLNKGIVGFFIFLHVGALMALFPFAFSWSAVALMLVLHWMTASLGICFGYHRYLTHRGMDLPKWLGNTLVFIGSLACQNGPLKWVAHHRMHHGGSDTDRDPHNAKDSLWWAHLGWMLYTNPEFDDPQVIRNYSKDIADNKFYQFLEDNYIKIQVALGLVFLAIGGLPWVIWGIFLRLVLVYHSTWFVNSAAHAFGYTNFKLENDLSTNCWWVGLIAYGEGWHNNHHAFPKSARHGLRPTEIDITWMSIWVLKKLGLAKNVRVAKLKRVPATTSTTQALEGEMVKQAA